jgi:hypothetical protein
VDEITIRWLDAVTLREGVAAVLPLLEAPGECPDLMGGWS